MPVKGPRGLFCSTRYIFSCRFRELEEALQLAEAQQQQAEAKSQQLEELQEKLRDLNAKVRLALLKQHCLDVHLWAFPLHPCSCISDWTHTSIQRMMCACVRCCIRGVLCR